jgi:hypothetical protein
MFSSRHALTTPANLNLTGELRYDSDPTESESDRPCLFNSAGIACSTGTFAALVTCVGRRAGAPGALGAKKKSAPGGAEPKVIFPATDVIILNQDVIVQI